jgi:GntP family permease
MASDPVRLAVVVIAILALIVLITKFRIHPFIALILVVSRDCLRASTGGSNQTF